MHSFIIDSAYAISKHYFNEKFDLKLNRGLHSSLYLKADSHHQLAEPQVTWDSDGS